MWQTIHYSSGIFAVGKLAVQAFESLVEFEDTSILMFLILSM